jgi:hypothetical protein
MFQKLLKVILLFNILLLSACNGGNSQLFKITVNNKTGYINKKGNVEITPLFDAAANFSEGLALVVINGKGGFINTRGEMVIAAEYDKGSSFSEGLVMVVKDNKCGYINKKGEIVIPLMYDRAGDFHEKLASVVLGDQHFYINNKNVEEMVKQDLLIKKEMRSFQPYMILREIFQKVTLWL